MSAYRFFQLDVFTDRRLAGNPLAVFADAQGLEPDRMQALAREMNLSETTFVTESKRATRRVRFFTPTAEIPLAGHPTIGTWWVLAELGHLELPSSGTVRVTQETGRGILPVEIVCVDGAPSLVWMTQAAPEFGNEVRDVATLATVLGGEPDAILPKPAPRVVSTALPQLMVPIRSLDVLRALPSGGMGGELASLLRSLETDCAMCYTTETESPDATVHCRMFAPGLGVPEDPATGSAAGALGCYLVRSGGVLPKEGVARIAVEQGIEIGRPSRINVEVTVGGTNEITHVRVGGRAVTVIEGEVRL